MRITQPKLSRPFKVSQNLQSNITGFLSMLPRQYKLQSQSLKYHNGMLKVLVCYQDNISYFCHLNKAKTFQSKSVIDSYLK